MKIKLDTVLLFALLIPFIMTYRLSPLDTQYWMFGLIFLGLFLYVVVDILSNKLKLGTYFTIKKILLWFLILASIGSGLFSEIVVRHQSSPIYNVHDIILQQEAAVKFFLHGTNPYSTNYLGTPLANWHYSDTEVNPALYHFVMEPFYLLFPVPFYLIMGHSIGFFDARVPLFFLFIALLILAQKAVKKDDDKLSFVTLLAFNPATLGYLIEGRDDIFMFAFLFAAFLLLEKKRYILAGIPMALAFAIKQSAWPIFPLYAAFLYFVNKKNIITVVRQMIPFILLFAVIVLPFFLWNPKAFLDSTIFYLSGSTEHSYPIAGYGFSMVLHQIGLIKDVHAYYPFWIWELIFGLPLMIILILWQKKNPSIYKLIVSYGLFLFVFWYFNRYFNNSHAGFLSMLIITAYFWQKQD